MITTMKRIQRNAIIPIKNKLPSGVTRYSKKFNVLSGLDNAAKIMLMMMIVTKTIVQKCFMLIDQKEKCELKRILKSPSVPSKTMPNRGHSIFTLYR